MLPDRVQTYLTAIAETCASGKRALASVILFGSAATGGFSGTISDVDLILVLADEAGAEDRQRMRREIERLEVLHGFRQTPDSKVGALETLVEGITANGCSHFICTRADLLSGNVGRILGLHPAQAVFVDRVVLPSILSVARTVWGEDLLAHIALPPIRRFDVFKSFFSLASQVITSAAVFPILPSATRYAMGAMKRSIHNCFFCYCGKPAALPEEIAFFQERLGPVAALNQLLELRRSYKTSFMFVLRCLPAMMRLHMRTASDNKFPRAALR